MIFQSTLDPELISYDFPEKIIVYVCLGASRTPSEGNSLIFATPILRFACFPGQSVEQTWEPELCFAYGVYNLRRVWRGPKNT